MSVSQGSYDSVGNLPPDPGSLYQELLQQEQQPADPYEILPIVGLTERSVEVEALLSAGITVSDLQNGSIIRQQLLDAGFVFLNRVGGGEKPLISGLIPLQSDDPSFLSTADRLLLTQDELDLVKKHQQDERAKQNIDDADLEAVRLGMLGFLAQAMEERDMEGERSVALFREAQAFIFESGAEDEKATLGDFMTNRAEEHKRTAWSGLHFVMQQCIADIDLSHVGGIPIAVLPTRLSALRGAASPFLDSGFHFGVNYDVTIHPHNPTKTRRLNMMNVHLLSRGFDEIGPSSNGSHDQTYLTAAEYLKMMDTPPQTAEQLSHDRQVLLVATRLMAVATQK